MNEDILRDHLEAPFHEGIHPAATVIRTKRNPTCGDEVTLSLVIEKDHVIEAWHCVRGCLLCRASASILCEQLQGMSLESVRILKENDALIWIDIPVSPGRRGCCTLPMATLLELLQNSDLLTSALDSSSDSDRRPD